MRRGTLCIGVILIVGWGRTGWPAQEQPALETVLERASQYAVDFVNRFSNVVAEEAYVENRISLGGRNQHQVLTSDFLLVKQPSDDYLAFRDVFRVNGLAVRDHDERIAKLFLTGATDAPNRAAEFNAEGARHIFGGFFHSPVTALGFLQPLYQTRFRFSLDSIEKGGRSTDGDVWIIDYREEDRPTVLRARNADLPSRGRFWIESATGRVLRTELQVAENSIVTLFRFDERFQIAVPVGGPSGIGAWVIGSQASRPTAAFDASRF